MNVAVSFVLMGVLVLFCTGKAFELKCTKNDDDTMEIQGSQKNDPTARQLQAINAALETDGCISTLDSNGAHVLTIIVECATGAQKSPDPGRSCYVTKDGTNLKVIIAQQQTPAVLAVNDKKYEVTCNCLDATPVAAPVAPVDLTGIQLTAGTYTARADTVKAELFDALSAAITTPQSLGAKFTIRVTFTPNTAGTPGEYPQAILIYNVIVSGTSTFDNSVQLITNNGCKNMSTAAGPFNLQKSFIITSTATPTVSETGFLDVVAFPGTGKKELYIRMFYKAICLTITDPRCANQQKYCDDKQLVRRRRGVDDIPTINGSLTLSVPIVIGGVQGLQSKYLTQDQTECRVPDVYWIISMVLGIMLLIVMALCVFLALRLRRERGKDGQFVGKGGEKNLSYT